MVSVVITTYNRRHFLREAVVSVMKQDYRDYEIIVVDDGSVDDSFKEIDDLPVRYIWKENGGVSSARNAGIEVSKGGYVAFLDVDDLWKRKKLSIQMEAMNRGGYDISYTGEIWIRNGNRINQKKIHRKYSGDIFLFCLPRCIIGPSSALIKKDIFKEVGLFDETLPVCEDYDMWLRITSRFNVLFIDEKLIIKRGGHADQLSSKYETLDQFRIKSLFKLYNSTALSNKNRELLKAELLKKADIYIGGAARRNKLNEIDYFTNIVEEVKGGSD